MDLSSVTQHVGDRALVSVSSYQRHMPSEASRTLCSKRHWDGKGGEGSSFSSLALSVCPALQGALSLSGSHCSPPPCSPASLTRHSNQRRPAAQLSNTWSGYCPRSHMRKPRHREGEEGTRPGGHDMC